ncbi:MAG: tetratricopeptide repeat protein [Acidobacteriota bacterium]|nr:tetratricopeptide repeat protein [Acidobacteriota bacterium]
MRRICWLATPALIIILGAQSLAQSVSSAPPATAALTIKTLPQTIIWVDSLRYGPMPASGQLTVKNLRAGAHAVRARLKGKREIIQTVALMAGADQTIQVALTAPADNAELHFQMAEELRDQSKHAEAIKEYHATIKLKPRGYPAARIGLARSLTVKEEFDDAVAEARRAMREKPGPYPEAHTVIANAKRSQGFYEDAVAEYRIALAQARDISPEAHTGLALADQELVRPDDAIKHFRLAVAQANDTEPVVYFLLGSALERERHNKEALEAYEKYLELQPNGSQAAAVRSVLKRLRREVK